MKLKQIRDDTRGGVIIEFTVTMGLFLLLTFGLVQAGLLLWAIVGLQHGVDMAARCASVNDAAIRTGHPTSLCFSPTIPTSVTKSTIQSYAAINSWGLKPPADIFVVDLATDTPATLCPNGLPGDRVSVSNYKFDLINYIFSLNLQARACYPTIWN